MREGRYIIFTTALLFVLILASCSGERRATIRASKADSIMYAAGETRDYQHILDMADSLQALGDLTEVNANRWRGVAYYYQGLLRTSEFYYKKAVSAPIKSKNDALNYNKSARRLAQMQLHKGDYEGALRIATEALEKMNENGSGSDTDFATLLNTVGCCELNLGRNELAAENFVKAYQLFRELAANDTTGRRGQLAFEGMCAVADQYLGTHHYEEAFPWINRAEEMIQIYEKMPGSEAAAKVLKSSHDKVSLLRAIALQHTGEDQEAAQLYSSAAKTSYGKSSEGRLYINDYLVAAGRYNEAADNFRDLDRLLALNGITLSLDNIQQYLLPKYRANVGANRKDSAIAVGQQISNALDNAINSAKQNDAAELATMYDTSQKDAEIAQQKESLTQQRLVASGIALILVMLFFTIYFIHKRNATNRLEAAHTKLQHAYDQLEVTTAAKERIESELRIARDIQKSMVPSVFPQREGLDMYASMTPAKEVGGDLYGYLLEGDKLYFCLGDVSGKGVPASLFMAQATRLFHTLAKQGMMPAEICTRMNEALSGEDNESGMFVTFFLGLVDLTTGHLDYCNAGHNPPVIGGCESHGEFLDVLPNAPIGLWPGLEYEGEQLDTIKGKPLFLYTDGLNEAEDTQQAQFGDDRLLDILRHTPFDNAQHVIEHLGEAVEQHRKGAEPNDDLTMLCLRIG
jgi:serine phosphatase RsbU (regulator of sigma subunit)